MLPLLMLGGAYLCYEGFEKLAHKLLHRRAKDDAHRVVGSDAAVDFVSAERAKVKGAVRTDFVLSAEIIVITLGTVARALFSRQLAVLVGISLLMTAFVYGLVAAIVKLDDGGLYLSRRAGDGFAARMQRRLGATVLRAAPLLMKALSIGGTAAMFLVGGGILAHDVPALHGWVEGLAMSLLLDVVVGIVAGALVWSGVGAVAALARRRGLTTP